MYERYAPTFLALLTEAFPMQANIVRCPPQSDLAFEVSWLLGTDPNRPNKSSQTIVTIFSSEFMQQFQLEDDVGKNTTLKRVERSLKLRLMSFDPEHDTPKQSPPPREVWSFLSSD